MKKQTKLFTVLILTILLICFITACVPSDSPSNHKEIVDGDTTEGGNGTNNTPNEDPAAEQATISEQKCFEYNGITVTARELVDESIWGAGIKLYIENNSDKDYSVGTEAVIVNNCMVRALFSCEVAAGKKTNDVLYLFSSDLEAAGISNIGQIEIYFYIYDSSSYERVYEAECVTIKTSLYNQMDTTADDSGHVLYNENGIKIVGKYVDENTFWGSSVLLYIENTSNCNITVSCDDMSVNGYMVTGFLLETVYQGKYAIGNITVMSSDLEENNITDIEEIELKFRIYNPDTFQTIQETDAIRFYAK